MKRAFYWPKDISVQSTCTEALTQCNIEEVIEVIAKFLKKKENIRRWERTGEEKAMETESNRWENAQRDAEHASIHQLSVHLLSLSDGGTDIVHAQKAVRKKTNEIIGAKALLQARFI